MKSRLPRRRLLGRGTFPRVELFRVCNVFDEVIQDAGADRKVLAECVYMINETTPT